MSQTAHLTSPPHSSRPSVEVTHLNNGITVLSEAMPGLQTVALGVWVQAGARHESERENGISHCLEHMAFKGTSRRSALQIAEEIEDIGADLNAATSTEHTAYYVRFLKDDLETAFDVIADIIRDPVFDADELEREREVILQEIASIQDSPEEIAYDLMQAAAYPGHALGRPIIGTPDHVRSFDTAQLRAYRSRNYISGNIVVSAAGGIDHARLVRLVEAQLADLPRGASDRPEPGAFGGGALSSARPFEQAHVLMAFPGPAYSDPEFFPAQIFCSLFGGGMSSRLFQEIRERRGLCYAIYASAWSLSDGGLFMIHAATGDDLVTQVSDVVLDELGRIAHDGPTVKEVARAKAQARMGLMMSTESPGARAEQMARQYFAFGRTLDAEELRARVEAVDQDDVAAFAAKLCAKRRIAVSVVGAGARSQSLAERTVDNTMQ